MYASRYRIVSQHGLELHAARAVLSYDVIRSYLHAKVFLGLCRDVIRHELHLTADIFGIVPVQVV